MIGALSLMAQGTAGEYPGNGDGFDSGCGYAVTPPGVVVPGAVDVGLAGNACGTFDVTTYGLADDGAMGFNWPVDFFNYPIDEAAVYGMRVQFGPQNNCCGVCIDFGLDLGQGGTCGDFGSQADLTAFGLASPQEWGQVFGNTNLIQYSDMCPNTEYFVFIQPVFSDFATVDDLGNCTANDAAGIWTNAGTPVEGTIVAPGVRDPLVINSATLALAGAVDCGAAEVLLDFTADIAAGCSTPTLFGPRSCSMGLEFEFRSSLDDCPAAGDVFAITTGPLVNDPTGCYVSALLSGQIALNIGTDACTLLECDHQRVLSYMQHIHFVKQMI